MVLEDDVGESTKLYTVRKALGERPSVTWYLSNKGKVVVLVQM